MKQYRVEVFSDHAIVVYTGVVTATDRLMAAEYGLDERHGAVSNVSFRVSNL